DWTGNGLRYVIRQLIALGIGGALAVLTALAPTLQLRKYRKAFYIAVMVGLVLTYVPGIQHVSKGAARWIGFGGFNVQPSEFAKIAVLVVLAHFLDRWRGYIRDWRVLLQAALIPAPVLLAVLLQPDFGTTAIIAGMCFMMLYVAGMKLSHVAILGGGGLAAGVPILLLEPYRLRRLVSFLDPFKYEDAGGHQVIQGWVAMHTGGLTGQGLGNSMAKLHFLPEPWTDFIGAVIGEELGWVGLVAVVGLYGLFVWRGLHIARRAKDAFGMFLAATITAMVGLEAFFNLAVILGLVPPKGLVLPFVSYGSSAMISHLWAVGILLSIAAEAREAPIPAGWPHRRTQLPTSTSTLPSVAR
ncbi:MAG: putative peptidoglycan glycosyltransferase FtsW, partial [Myxococcota bacterium]|nr:putative peptidoglycan glycosyltransferase FtsW [Myxococcota bacterium]